MIQNVVSSFQPHAPPPPPPTSASRQYVSLSHVSD